MSSHDRDRLPGEGAAARKNSGVARTAAGAAASRTAARDGEKSGGRVPTQRAKATQRTAKPVTAKATKTPVAKPSTAKAPASKVAPAKTPAAKAAPAEASAATTSLTKSATTGARPRPTPHPRAADLPEAPAPEPVREVVAVEDAAALVAVEEARSLSVLQDTVPVVARPGGRRRVEATPFRRILTALSAGARRRQSVYLAAALTATVGLGVLSGGGPEAQAAGAGHSVSVAQELGVSSNQKLLAADSAPRRLEDLVASRAQREALQTAAAQTQRQADQRAIAAAEAARPKAVLPIHGAHMTTCFCMRWGVMHEGIDLAAPFGTPEYAAMDGVVLKAGPASGFGQAVYIQHQNGDVTVYGHMEKILVTDGQVVHAGDTIALEGAEGQSTGPHLHFEVHQGGLEGPRLDPVAWLRQRGVAI